MRRAGHLFERLLTWENLLSATHKAARGKKSRPAVARFLFHLETELLDLRQELESGLWRPRPYRRFSIRDPKPRIISAADFRDRVVHHAVMNVLDPYFERRLFGHSYACRRGKGTHAAVRFAQGQARRFPYFFKGDVDRFFESVDHGVLRDRLRRMFKDRRLLDLLDRIITSAGAERGLPIGSLTSQYFANHLLGELDRFVKQDLRVRGYLRFMDDFVLFAAAKPDLHRHRAAVRSFLAETLRLELKERASWIAPSGSGVPFLGFRIYPRTIRLEGVRWRRMRRKIRRREQEFRDGEISAEVLADSVRSSLAHVEHAATRQLRRKSFEDSGGLG